MLIENLGWLKYDKLEIINDWLLFGYRAHGGDGRGRGFLAVRFFLLY